MKKIFILMMLLTLCLVSCKEDEPKQYYVCDMQEKFTCLDASNAKNVIDPETKELVDISDKSFEIYCDSVEGVVTSSCSTNDLLGTCTYAATKVNIYYYDGGSLASDLKSMCEGFGGIWK